MKKNIIIIAILVLIDQIIKIVVYNTLRFVENEIILIPKVLSLKYLENYGASFGLVFTQMLLIGLGLVIIIGIIRVLFNKKYQLDNISKLGLSLVLAGGIGNLIDRVFRGCVIDYLDISHLFEFPIFNFADICVNAGVILVIITILVKTVKAQEEK